MKNLIIGLIVGVVVAVPVSAVAWTHTQMAQPIRVANCAKGDPDDCGVEISKFKDGNNTCYVATRNIAFTDGSTNEASISCVGVTK